jgi:hypothetical protein
MKSYRNSGEAEINCDAKQLKCSAVLHANHRLKIGKADRGEYREAAGAVGKNIEIQEGDTCVMTRAAHRAVAPRWRGWCGAHTLGILHLHPVPMKNCDRQHSNAVFFD